MRNFLDEKLESCVSLWPDKLPLRSTRRERVVVFSAYKYKHYFASMTVSKVLHHFNKMHVNSNVCCWVEKFWLIDWLIITLTRTKKFSIQVHDRSALEEWFRSWATCVATRVLFLAGTNSVHLAVHTPLAPRERLTLCIRALYDGTDLCYWMFLNCVMLQMLN
jgi:hypothetical protein